MTSAPDGLKAKWTRFWFTPADPTTLGFMRVVTGLLCLYIHAAYSLDLQAFFGKDGWYGLHEVTKERKEYPWLLSPFFGPEAWQDITPSAHVPVYPHRRAAVVQFLKDLPADPDNRRAALALLSRLQATQNRATIQDGLTYVRGLPGDAKALEAHLAAMVDPKLRTAVDQVPGYLDTLPQAGPDSRDVVRKELLALLAALPKDADQRRFVIDHLLESPYPQRQRFVEFALGLPLDPAERTRQIDHLEFWNSEPGAAYKLGHPSFSVWMHLSDPTSMAVMHGCILVVIFLFTIGYCTRVTSVLTWLAAVSYIHRTHQVLFGMDTMMNILLIYLMVGNSGAALSVDRLINRYRAARRSLDRTGGLDAPTRAYLAAPPRSVSAGFTYRLIQIHFCFIYMAAGLSKLKGPAWWTTNAYWDTLVNPEFTLVHFQWYESMVRSAVEHRWMYAAMAAFGVYFTLLLEISLPFLVWTRMRPWVVIGGVFLHVGISVFMGLILFGLLMMTLLVSYIPGATVRQLLAGDGPRLAFRFNARSPAHRRAAALAAALDTDNRLELTDAGPGAVSVLSDGQPLGTGEAAGEKLFGRLAVSRKVWLLLLVPGLGGWLAGRLSPADDAPATVAEPVGAK